MSDTKVCPDGDFGLAIGPVEFHLNFEGNGHEAPPSLDPPLLLLDAPPLLLLDAPLLLLLDAPLLLLDEPLPLLDEPLPLLDEPLPLLDEPLPLLDEPLPLLDEPLPLLDEPLPLLDEPLPLLPDAPLLLPLLPDAPLLLPLLLEASGASPSPKSQEIRKSTNPSPKCGYALLRHELFIALPPQGPRTRHRFQAATRAAASGRAK